MTAVANINRCLALTARMQLATVGIRPRPDETRLFFEVLFSPSAVRSLTDVRDGLWGIDRMFGVPVIYPELPYVTDSDVVCLELTVIPSFQKVRTLILTTLIRQANALNFTTIFDETSVEEI